MMSREIRWNSFRESRWLDFALENQSAKLPSPYRTVFSLNPHTYQYPDTNSFSNDLCVSFSRSRMGILVGGFSQDVSPVSAALISIPLEDPSLYHRNLCGTFLELLYQHIQWRCSEDLFFFGDKLISKSFWLIGTLKSILILFEKRFWVCKKKPKVEVVWDALRLMVFCCVEKQPELLALFMPCETGILSTKN